MPFSPEFYKSGILLQNMGGFFFLFFSHYTMSSIVNKIKETVIGNKGDQEFKGKVINVVNQIPYNCILDISNTNQSIIEKLKQLKIQKNPFNVYSEITPVHTPTEELDLNPISQVQKRRSTITALGQTNIWRLTQRRGHSAMYAAIDSLKKNHETLYIGSTGSIVTDENDPIEIDDINEEERESLRDLLRSKYDMVPIFINDKLSSGHYEGYSKQGKAFIYRKSYCTHYTFLKFFGHSCIT